MNRCSECGKNLLIKLKDRWICLKCYDKLLKLKAKAVTYPKINWDEGSIS